MATSHRARRASVAQRMQPLADGGLRLVLLTFVITLGAGLFALALLPAVGAAGRSVQRFTDEFGRLGADIDLHFPAFPERSTIYAADGSVMATVFLDENRKIVRMKSMGDLVPQAVLAIEDARFYDHPGLDLQGIVRALVENMRAGDVEQGGSTITQQLARNVFPEVGTEETLARKVAEARVAVRLEEAYSKRKILTLYLNEVYLGQGVYGMGTAAQYYFGKRMKDLEVHEAALLAGLIAAPERLNPVDNEKAAVARRNVVLNRMAEVGSITAQEAGEAKKKPLGLNVKDVTQRQRFPFFLQWVKSQILSDERFGKTFNQRRRTLFQGGLHIHTTLEPRLQQAGERGARRHLPAPEDPEVATAAVEARTGAIKALVSSQRFSDSQVNLATGQGGTGRQPGSAFKPFTLVAAFEQGIPPTTVYDGASGQIVNCSPYGPPDYRAVNAGDSGGGKLDLWGATQGSVNAVFVQLAVDAGVPNIVDVAHRMGIQSELDPYCSITLGTEEVTPLEMASAYATLANRGKRCEPFGISRVENRHGKVVFKHRRGACKQVIDREIADLVVNMLHRVVTGGTGTAANLGTWPTFGKTGTTNDSGDAWFSGCTMQICATTWVGHEKARIPMTSVHGITVYGGTFPAQIWRDFMMVAMQGLRAIPLPPVPSISWPTITVPDVVGEPVGKARSTIEEAGFTPVAEEVDSTEPKGVVVSQSPSGGSEATPGSAVKLGVSTGRAPTARVPDVVGMSESRARGVLENAGFAASVSYERTNRENVDGTVAAQSPGGGTRADEGATVQVTVYRYEKPEKPDKPEEKPKDEGKPKDKGKGKGDGKDKGKPPSPSPSPSPEDD